MLRFFQIGLPPLLVALLLATSLTAVAAAKPFTYINARFGTVCSFPIQLFSKPMPEPENGDGREWQSPDGASVACYGGYNGLDSNPDSLVDDEKGYTGEQVTYSKTGKNWAVISGTKADRIFYARIVFGKKDVIHTVRIEYPASLKAKYDPLIGAIARSLHESSGPHWE